jgi:hypothetical protein
MAPAIRFLAQGLGLSLPEEPFIAAHTDTLLVFVSSQDGLDSCQTKMDLAGAVLGDLVWASRHDAQS